MSKSTSTVFNPGILNNLTYGASAGARVSPVALPLCPRLEMAFDAPVFAESSPE